MREVTTKVFNFEELTKEAQEKAIEQYKDKGWTWDDADSGMLTECFQERLSEKGLPTDVAWSLGCCQGDGVAFYGEVDILEWVKQHEDQFTEKELKRIEFAVKCCTLTMNISDNNHHYCHAYTMSVDADYYMEYLAGQKLIDDTVDKLRCAILHDIRNVSKELENMGYNDIDYRNSDECIRENIIANEYEFTEDGMFF